MNLLESKKFSRIIIHFGGDKTGSTAIQTAFNHARDHLIEQHLIAYPPGQCHAELGSAMCDCPEEYIFNVLRSIKSRELLQHLGSEYLKELSQWLMDIPPCECLVFSYEGFPYLNLVSLVNLREFCTSYSDVVDVVIYVRAPLSYSVSAINQRLKQGRQPWKNDDLPIVRHKYIIKKIAQVFGQQHIIVRPFIAASLKNGDVVSDFFSILKFSDSDMNFLQNAIKGSNESLTNNAAHVGMALLKNLADRGIYYSEGAFYHNIGQHLTIIPGDKIKLMPSQISAILLASQEHTDYLASEFDIVFNEDSALYVEHYSPSSESKKNDILISAFGKVLANIFTGWFAPRELQTEFRTNDILVAKSSLLEGYDITQGQSMSFELFFLLLRPVEELEMSISIYNTDKRQVFGTNSTLLSQIQRQVASGEYKVVYQVSASLPVGHYTVGFSFAERAQEDVRDLYWTATACEFNIKNRTLDVDYIDQSANIIFQRSIQENASSVVKMPRGRIELLIPPTRISSSETISLIVKVFNEGTEPWGCGLFRPVNISYHWRDTSKRVIAFEGLRTTLPEGGVPPGESVTLIVQIQAPNTPNVPDRYFLELTVMQEDVHWFEEVGSDFKSMIVEVLIDG